MDKTQSQQFICQMWDESIIPELCENIKIPNKSPMFDPDWKQQGHMDRAVALLESWCEKQPIRGMTTEVIRLEGRTPVLFMGMLGERFSQAQFLITGLLGPNSNAHGPNEFLHIDTGKKLTCCVAQVLEDQFQH